MHVFGLWQDARIPEGIMQTVRPHPNQESNFDAPGKIKPINNFTSRVKSFCNFK